MFALRELNIVRGKRDLAERFNLMFAALFVCGV
jgi:hypothetical protein